MRLSQVLRLSLLSLGIWTEGWGDKIWLLAPLVSGTCSISVLWPCAGSEIKASEGRIPSAGWSSGVASWLVWKCWWGLVAQASCPPPGWHRLRAAAAAASACRQGAREGWSRSESSKYLPVFLSPSASEGSLPLPFHLALVYTPDQFFVCV